LRLNLIVISASVQTMIRSTVDKLGRTGLIATGSMLTIDGGMTEQ
jgi:hypothetical protein